MKKYDVVILGAGPAGLSASIYLSRMEVSNLVIDKGPPGGKLLNTFRVDNYSGMVGKDGPTIALEFLNHAKKFGSEIIKANLKEIKGIEKREKTIILDNNEKIITKSIIVATGLEPRKLEVDNYDQLFGKGIYTCLVCDAPLYKNKDIVVIGGGNSALEESIFAKNFVKNLYIINIAKQPTAYKYIKDEIEKNKNVKIINSFALSKINLNQNKKIESIIIKNVNTGQEKKIEASAVFTYIGWIPNTTFLPNEILNKEKYIVAKKDNSTKIKGIFAAGDVIEREYKQISIATSDGAIAALSAKKYIEQLK